MIDASPLLRVVVTHLSQAQQPSHNVAAMASRRVLSEKPVHSEKFLKYTEFDEVEKAPRRKHLK